MHFKTMSIFLLKYLYKKSFKKSPHKCFKRTTMEKHTAHNNNNLFINLIINTQLLSFHFKYSNLLLYHLK